MNASPRLLAAPVIMVLLVGGVLVLIGVGGDGDSGPAGAAVHAPASPPVELGLEQAHASGVSGTARLAPNGAEMTVTLTLSEPVAGSLPAHIHTGPCSDEPTLENPRIWANLTEVIEGRSVTRVNVATLDELRSEPASINVHDPEHGNRSLVCGDIPRS